MAFCPVIDPNNPPVPPPLPAVRFLFNTPFLAKPTRACQKRGEFNECCLPAFPEDAHDAKRMFTPAYKARTAGITVYPDEFMRDSKEAPGGNRYWKKTVDVTPARLIANADGIADAFCRAKMISRRHFQAHFGPGKEHASMLMKDVLTKYNGMLEPKLGIITTLAPKPTERADAYVKRGGYLLWTGGWPNSGGGVFGRFVTEDGMTTGTYPLQSGTFDWQPQNVHGFSLRIMWNWKRNRLTYIIRLAYDDAWEKVGNAINNAVDKIKGLVCKGLSSDLMKMGATMVATAAATAVASPAGGVAAAAATEAAWQLAANQCGQTMPTCELDPNAPPPPPLFPAGSIAYYDKKKGVYLIAAPKGLAGFEPTHTITGQTYPTVPAGAVLEMVGIIGWQNATQTWYRRTWIQGVAAGVVVLGAAVVIKRRRPTVRT